MLKIGLASALLIAVCLAAFAQIRGDQFEQRGDSTISGGKVLIVRDSADLRQSSAGFGMPNGAIPNRALPNHPVIWHPDPTGVNPFGFIPTEWTTRPQLLPLTWDVRTVFAANSAGTRVTMLRVD